MENNDGLNLDNEMSTAYKSAILQNVHIAPAPLGNICGIYKELEPGVYQIFLNDELMDENSNKHDLCDKTLYILMKHHNSSKKGETKVVTIDNLKFFDRLKEEVKRYERLAVEAFMRSITFKRIFSN